MTGNGADVMEAGTSPHLTKLVLIRGNVKVKCELIYGQIYATLHHA